MAENEKSTPDSTRDRFREALEKKRSAQHGGQSHLDSNKHVGPASSNQKATRMYRRKSGGS